MDEDGAWARERARAAVEPYLGVVAHLDPTLELRAGEAPPFDRFCIAGTPEEVAERVRELWAAGADRVELGTPQGRTPASGVDLDLRPRAASPALVGSGARLRCCASTGRSFTG